MRGPALATGLVFALSGFVFASWVSRLPATRDRIGASSGQLGIALLMSGLGSLVIMPITGRLCARFGSRAVVTVHSMVACAVLVGVAFVPDVVVLGAVLFVFGAVYGAWDVAMNVHGSEVEQRAARDWMPRYHGCWSVGGIVGGAGGALAARLDVTVGMHFVLAALVSAGLLLWTVRAFVDDRVAEVAHRHEGVGSDAGSPGRRGVLSPVLVAIGLVTLCATLIEGSANDWLALYLNDDRGVGQGAAAAGFTVFAVAMAGGRFAGTAVIAALGRHRAVRFGGLTASVGIVASLTGPGLASAYAGAVLWGLGVAVMFPAAMSAGGEAGGPDGIAAVSTIGYAGFLVGPPLIGLVAEHVGLGRALFAPVVLGVAAMLLAPAVRQRAAAPARSLASLEQGPPPVVPER